MICAKDTANCQLLCLMILCTKVYHSTQNDIEQNMDKAQYYNICLSSLCGQKTSCRGRYNLILNIGNRMSWNCSCVPFVYHQVENQKKWYKIKRHKSKQNEKKELTNRNITAFINTELHRNIRNAHCQP